MPPRAGRRTLSPRLAYALAGAIIGLALFASGTPSPLYGTYRELWGFSPLVLTLVYATYAFGVLGALLLAGRISDDVGRRPVLLVALGTLMASTLLFMVADSGGCSSRAPCRAPRPAWRSAPPAPRCWTCTRAATRPASA
jgi:MFS family permease